MIAFFRDDFGDSLKKHSALKKIVQNKVDMILTNPAGLGEPLKGNLRGYYGVPVKNNFLIIYLYCLICRQRRDDGIVLCHDCSNCADETVKFIQLGPDDHVNDP
jgi:hypothetical protein